ncbi:4xEZ_heat domain protein [Cryptosporidium xiaoi]|uniref:Deoxyhypusine hydroxylase n=1 Tax=Cryptosporidium xiaoi TaxID=659607 RepID=A0AAV9XWM9_9CRYT
MEVSVSKNELTPKLMLPGCAIKPVDGGEYQSFNIYSKEKIRDILLNREADISSKIRCLFFGRFHGDEESSEILIKSLSYSDSVLYRHEVLYVLGQMGLKSPLDHLYNILGDINEHPMVRHEAGEAIAAIGDISSIDIIEKYLNDDSPAVRETCYLAQHSLKMKSMKKEEGGSENDNLLYCEDESNDCNNISDFNAFNTRDPTPPNKSCETTQIESLVLDLLNGEMHLEKRYGALFALRNILTGVINSNQRSSLISNNLKYKNGSEMVNYIANKIAEAMEYDNKSAVFRHECAFVLGQVQVISTADSLSRVVSNIMEESMVRHEAAFALGSVGSTDPRFCNHTESEDLFNCNKDDVKRIRKLAIETLTKFSNDPDIIVSESCIVGLQTIFDETGTLEIEI